MPKTESIKERMKILGLTQADLAKIIGIAVPTMCQKINNIRPFSLEEAERIAKELKIPDSEFSKYFFES